MDFYNTIFFNATGNRGQFSQYFCYSLDCIDCKIDKIKLIFNNYIED